LANYIGSLAADFSLASARFSTTGPLTVTSSPPNPYASPEFSADAASAHPAPAVLSTAILVQQRVVAILLLINGSLLLVMGVVLVFVAIFVPAMIEADMRRGNQAQPANFSIILKTTYGVMSACGLIAGGLQVYAGFRNLWLKNYTLGIVALSTGVLSFGTCYCVPTSLVLLVYGLIIYLHPTTKFAFEAAKQGRTHRELMDLAAQARMYSNLPGTSPFAQ
jgi:hypothetical protein